VISVIEWLFPSNASGLRSRRAWGDFQSLFKSLERTLPCGFRIDQNIPKDLQPI
jgi:hypothetical protein